MKLILISNPGSASRKYALYNGEELLAALHFEYVRKKVVCTVRDGENEKQVKVEFADLADTVRHIGKILQDEGYINERNKLFAIVVRLVAPGDYFAEDRIVDNEFMKNLEIAKKRAPLHLPVVADEISHFSEIFPEVKIAAISDSAFHWSKPDLMKYYPFDTEVADKFGIKRYGYHGLSYGFVTNYLEEQGILQDKLIAAHIGSGSSVAAILEGNPMDTSMGYSPLEGLMMSTRSGSMDVAAAVAIKRELGLKTDEDLERYLNKEAGLLGVSGFSDDMREIIQRRDEGDPKATFAHALFVYRVQNLIGQMAASLGGVDALVFTATIGERSDEIRHYVCQKLKYLGFMLEDEKNREPEFTGRHALISAKDSKPIYIVKTDETAEMIRKALVLMAEMQEVEE
ncbi:MAG: acetate/propionate family kinase [Candidatus Nomurabacteria bacterium]|jgi:acetate kinase|nr:acetate/propionate family kinase [Candidatus Nomurabacteria bacterium]